MSAWSHLPNAKHIDWVLASVKENPKAWKGAWAASWAAAREAAWEAALDAARGDAWDAAAAWSSAWGASRSAISALIAYDHCEKYPSMTPDELYVWWKLSDDPACILLIPMVKVMNKKELV
jgi:hypothetical protein